MIHELRQFVTGRLTTRVSSKHSYMKPTCELSQHLYTPIISHTLRRQASVKSTTSNHTLPSRRPNTTSLRMDTLPPLHYIIAYAIPCLWISVFFGLLINPHSVSAMAGFDLPKNQPPSVFLYLFAVRELGLAVVFTMLAAYGEWRALTIFMGNSLIFGTADMVVCGMKGKGWGAAVKNHGVPTVLAAWAVKELAKEYF